MKGPGSLLSAGDPRLAPVSPSIKPKENKLIEKPGHRDAGKWPKSTHVALISRDPRLSSPSGRHQRLFLDTLLPKTGGCSQYPAYLDSQRFHIDQYWPRPP